MKHPASRRFLLPQDAQRHPQLPLLAVLRQSAVAVVPALLCAHPGVAADRLSQSAELAADNVVRLAERLRLAIDNYRRALRDCDHLF
jgi:hypothetical protein